MSTTYERAIHELGIEKRVVVMPGVETTGHILFYKPPGQGVSRVIGHYNFWPLAYDRDVPRNGAPWTRRSSPACSSIGSCR